MCKAHCAEPHISSCQFREVEVREHPGTEEIRFRWTLDSGFISITYKLCNLGQFTSALCTEFSLCQKRN